MASVADGEIVEQTRLQSKEQVEKAKMEFNKQEHVIKGECFSELLDNIDKHINKSKWRNRSERNRN